jgi:hypothetical protein
MTRINSVANIPNSDEFLACGHYFVNEEAILLTSADTKLFQTSAVIMKVKGDG